MIERCREAYPVRLMCRCLGVSASGYYAWRERSPSARQRDNERLLRRIRTLHGASDGVLGSPRICDELRYRGERCGRHRVARLMRAHGLQGVPRRRRWRYKSSGQRPGDVQNHLSRDFTADTANRKWVTDITYIRTGESWLYLCVVIDLYSGLVVGWSMSLRQDRQMVLQAVLMALWQRREQGPVVLLGSGLSVHQRGVSALPARPQSDLQHECRGYLCGQRGSRELLRNAQARTRQPAPVPHQGRGQSRRLRLHRAVP